MEVIAESPKWVDKSSKVIEEDFYDDDDEDEERDRHYDSEDWPSYTGWMELEGVEEDDLGSAKQTLTTLCCKKKVVPFCL